MRYRFLSTARSALGLLCITFILSTCQDYEFEGLTRFSPNPSPRPDFLTAPPDVDVLFILDNTASMFNKQQNLASSFDAFIHVLDDRLGHDHYHIGIITTGMLSPQCPACSPEQASQCIHELGESGAFQYRLGSYEINASGEPIFSFDPDENCRVIKTAAETSCLYDEATDQGTVLVGLQGCDYERGLASMRPALSDLLNTANMGFLREHAMLSVVVVSDEDDCGEVGDITEGIIGADDRLCYYASKEIGPNNTFSHPDDPAATPYRLTPVDAYYDFLMGLKNHRAGMVKFAAIVGTRDTGDLDTTTIEYTNDSDPNSRIESVCQTPGCTGDHCEAWPGTRYIRLAQKFGIGKQGFVDTICQTDFSATLEALGEFVYCPRIFNLNQEILDPGMANILLNDVAVPRYSCSESGTEIQECEDLADTSCTCVKTWSYHPPTGAPEAPGGTITFAEHYDPCERVTEGEIRIELVYFTP